MRVRLTKCAKPLRASRDGSDETGCRGIESPRLILTPGNGSVPLCGPFWPGPAAKASARRATDTSPNIDSQAHWGSDIDGGNDRNRGAGPRRETLVQGSLHSGADRDRARRRRRLAMARCCDQRLDQGARRRLRQADQDGDRADHLLHRGHRASRISRTPRRSAASASRRWSISRSSRPSRWSSGSSSANLVRPGAGFGGDPGRCATVRLSPTRPKRHEAASISSFDIIPDTVVGAFAKGDILQVLLFSILFGFALMALGERGHSRACLHRRCGARGFRHHRASS